MSFNGYATIELTGTSTDIEFGASWKFGMRPSPDLTQIPYNNRVWIDLGERARTIDLNGSYFTSSGDYATVTGILDETTTKTLKIRRPDGTYINSLTVGTMAYSAGQQIDYAGTRFKIEKIKFAEAA